MLTGERRCLSTDPEADFVFAAMDANGNTSKPDIVFSHDVRIVSRAGALSKDASIGLGVGLGLGLGGVLLGLGVFFAIRRRRRPSPPGDTSISEKTGELEYVEEAATGKWG